MCFWSTLSKGTVACKSVLVWLTTGRDVSSRDKAKEDLSSKDWSGEVAGILRGTSC